MERHFQHELSLAADAATQLRELVADRDHTIEQLTLMQVVCGCVRDLGWCRFVSFRVFVRVSLFEPVLVWFWFVVIRVFSNKPRGTTNSGSDAGGRG